MTKTRKIDLNIVKKDIMNILSKGPTNMVSLSHQLHINLPNIIWCCGRLMDEGRVQWNNK